MKKSLTILVSYLLLGFPLMSQTTHHRIYPGTFESYGAGDTLQIEMNDTLVLRPGDEVTFCMGDPGARQAGDWSGMGAASGTKYFTTTCPTNSGSSRILFQRTGFQDEEIEVLYGNYPWPGDCNADGVRDTRDFFLINDNKSALDNSPNWPPDIARTPQNDNRLIFEEGPWLKMVAGSWVEDEVNWMGTLVNMVHLDVDGSGKVDFADAELLRDKLTPMYAENFLTGQISGAKLHATANLSDVRVINHNDPARPLGLEIPHDVVITGLPSGMTQLIINGVIFSRPAAESQCYDIDTIVSHVDQSAIITNPSNAITNARYFDDIPVEGNFPECLDATDKLLDVAILNNDTTITIQASQLVPGAYPKCVNCGVTIVDIFKCHPPGSPTGPPVLPVYLHLFNGLIFGEDPATGMPVVLEAECSSDSISINLDSLFPRQLYVMDDPADVGNEPNYRKPLQWVSPDIWVRNQADGKEEHQNPVPGDTNYVYVRIRNKGASDFSGGELSLHWARANSREAWPSGFDGTTNCPVSNKVLGKSLLPTHLPIPDVPALGSVVMEIRWLTPEAGDYQGGLKFTGESPIHSLVARIDCANDPMNNESNGVEIYQNLHLNNNIATRSMMLATAPQQIGDTLQRTGFPSFNFGTEVFWNPENKGEEVKIIWELLQGSAAEDWRDYGDFQLTWNKGFENLLHPSVMMPGIAPVPGVQQLYRLTAVDTAMIDWVAFSKNAAHTLAARFQPDSISPTGPLTWQIRVYQTIDSDSATREFNSVVYEFSVPDTIYAWSNSPVKGGSALQLSAASLSGGTYEWQGPNGFTSNLRTPEITSAQSSHSGMYKVRWISAAGDTSSWAYVPVKVKAAGGTGGIKNATISQVKFTPSLFSETTTGEIEVDQATDVTIRVKGWLSGEILTETLAAKAGKNSWTWDRSTASGKKRKFGFYKIQADTGFDKKGRTVFLLKL